MALTARHLKTFSKLVRTLRLADEATDRVCITKSRSGHYTVTVKGGGYEVKEVKLGSLAHAREAVPNLKIKLMRKINREKSHGE